MKTKDIRTMQAKLSGDFEDVSDEGSIASLETSSSTSSAAVDLPPGWEVALADDKGRLYYIDNDKKATNWCPPLKAWKCCFGLPFGWEVAIDAKHFLYYVNHGTQATTYKHPNYENKQFEAIHQALQAKRRKVVIKRHTRDGFGFVAGSEKPVIIRSVVAGSPADGQLSANDQLFSINGQIAYNLPQPQVISMIRSCTDVLEMEVIATEDIQDVRNQGTLKSALMSRATRERRKSCPVSVRFEEKPEVVSLSAPSILSVNIIKQMIPNVLKIYLENGQTKSFQYNTETTVKEIFDSLIERLQIKESKHFALVLIGPYPNQSIFLQPEDRVTQIVNKKVFSHWECRLELSFIPNDAFELLGKDPIAFDYWYQQTCDSVVKGHFGSELKFDAVMRLAALQIHVAMTSENEDTKFTLKDVSKEYGGLDDFLPNGIITNFKKKDIKKALMGQLKSLSRIALPGQKLTPLQAKLHYLKIASQNPIFGGRMISAHVVANRLGSDSPVDTTLDTSDILISPSKGICTLFSDTGNLLQQLVDISSVTGLVMTSHMMNKNLLKIFVKDRKAISFILSAQDADDAAFMICRYHNVQLKTGTDLPFYNLSQTIPRCKAPEDSKAPSYSGEHNVVPSTWSYIDDVVPTLWLGSNSMGDQNPMKTISVSANFSTGPPKYTSQTSYDRSSFVPFRQRPAVDSLIRELSIRDKKRKKVNTSLNGSGAESPQKASSAGQFDTTHFGHGSALVEEEDPDQNTSEKCSPQVTRHIITCSMSSDEESSDEELNELARKINRSGTVARFLKNKDNNRGKVAANGKIDKAAVVRLDDEEDSGWPTDTSSNTGSLGRSNPWGTFSEEDSSDKDSLRHLNDSDSLFSHRDELYEPSDPTSISNTPDMEKFLIKHDAQMLHQNVAMSSVAKDDEIIPNGDLKHPLVETKCDSFEKYLVNKLPNNADTENSPFDELASDLDERPASLLRPLSEISDDVFTGDEQVYKENPIHKPDHDEAENEFKVTRNHDESHPSTSDSESTEPADTFVAPATAGIKSSESLSSSLSSLELHANEQFEGIDLNNESHLDERPKSVNLADLDIYIPGPPKEPTRALSPSELMIPSPPLEFADNEESNISFQFLDDDEKTSSSESSNKSALSSFSSSSEDVVEFMVNKSVESSTPTKSTFVSGDNSLNNEDSNDEEEVEFMKPEDNVNVRLYDEQKSVSNKAQVEDTKLMPEQNNNDTDKLLAVSPMRKLPSIKKSYSLNENEKMRYQGLNTLLAAEMRDDGSRRQSEPLVTPLTLPKSPSLDLKKERIMSPLFFSAENESPSSSQVHHFRSHSDNESKPDHSESPLKSSAENHRLLLPSTPLSLRKNQYFALNSTENVSKFNSLPNSFTFDEFNEYIDACKAAIAKAVQLEGELDVLITENKRANRLSFESEDPERHSYSDVMRTCAKSLSNKTKELAPMSTSGNVTGLRRFIRSSQNEVQSMVVAITTLKNSTTVANLVKDVVVEYIEVVKCLKKSTGKPLTDPDVVKLVEKINELSFSSTILVRGLRSS